MLDHPPATGSLRFRFAISLLVAALWTTPLQAQDIENLLKSAGYPVNWTVLYLDENRKPIYEYRGQESEGAPIRIFSDGPNHRISNNSSYIYLLETKEHLPFTWVEDWTVTFSRGDYGNADTPTDANLTSKLASGFKVIVSPLGGDSSGKRGIVKRTGQYIAVFDTNIGFIPIQNTGHFKVSVTWDGVDWDPELEVTCGGGLTTC